MPFILRLDLSVFNAVNGLAGADTITVDAAVFNPGTILLTGALPDITTDVTITGLGATLVTVTLWLAGWEPSSSMAETTIVRSAGPLT